MSQQNNFEILSPSLASAGILASLRPDPAILQALERLENALENLTKVRLRQAPETAWMRFLSFPTETQQVIAKAWNGQAEFIEGAVKEGLDAFNELAMLKYAYDRLGFLGDAAVVEDIQPGDIIEIADEDYVQVYRSFSYFSLCNYSIVELSAYPWFELYERSSVVTKQLLEGQDLILKGKSTRFNFDLPEYTLRELMTEECATFTLKEKYVIRLISALSGKTYALSVKQVREIESMKNRMGYI